MGAAIELRKDFDGTALRALARKTRDAQQARRLLAIAEIDDGGERGDAARVGGNGLQTIRDGVLGFNAAGPAGLIDGKAPGRSPKLDAAQKRKPAAIIEADFEETMIGLVSKIAIALNENVSGLLVHLQRIAIVALLLVVSGCTGKPDSVDPVRPFDVHRYKGEWFEIMRLDHSFERGLTNVTATYTLRDDGSVGVLNRGFDGKTCRWKEANGRAIFQGSRDIASLSVTFFWPFAGGYHVFALDQQDYGWALISGPSRSYLWILARQRDLSADLRGRLVGEARRLGFPVDDLILVDHGEPACASDQASSK